MATIPMSKSAPSCWASCTCSVLKRAVNGSCGPVTETPRWRMVSTCSGQESMTVTSCPARAKNDAR